MPKCHRGREFNRSICTVQSNNAVRERSFGVIARINMRDRVLLNSEFYDRIIFQITNPRLLGNGLDAKMCYILSANLAAFQNMQNGFKENCRKLQGKWDVEQELQSM